MTNTKYKLTRYISTFKHAVDNGRMAIVGDGDRAAYQAAVAATGCEKYSQVWEYYSAADLLSLGFPDWASAVQADKA